MEKRDLVHKKSELTSSGQTGVPTYEKPSYVSSVLTVRGTEGFFYAITGKPTGEFNEKTLTNGDSEVKVRTMEVEVEGESPFDVVTLNFIYYVDSPEFNEIYANIYKALVLDPRFVEEGKDSVDLDFSLDKYEEVIIRNGASSLSFVPIQDSYQYLGETELNELKEFSTKYLGRDSSYYNDLLTKGYVEEIIGEDILLFNILGVGS